MSNVVSSLLVAFSLSFAAMTFAQTDTPKNVIDIVSSFRRLDPKGREFEGRRKELFNTPQWQETSWRELERLANASHLSQELVDSYQQNKKVLFEKRKSATTNAEIDRIDGERNALAKELQMKSEALKELSRIANGLGSLRSKEAIPLIAPLLDSNSIELSEGDIVFGSPQAIASLALSQLHASGVEVSGASSGMVQPVNWNDWWKREKKNYTRFRLTNPVAVSDSKHHGTNGPTTARMPDPVIESANQEISGRFSQDKFVRTSQTSNKRVYIAFASAVGVLSLGYFALRWRK